LLVCAPADYEMHMYFFRKSFDRVMSCVACRACMPGQPYAVSMRGCEYSITRILGVSVTKASGDIYRCLGQVTLRVVLPELPALLSGVVRGLV
jgi:hypothetical protein